MFAPVELYRCDATETFRLDRGEVIRDAETELWRGLLRPFVVDTGTGNVVMGPETSPVRWDILQAGTNEWDFIAERVVSRNMTLNVRIRVWEDPVQFVITINGFVFAAGLCAPLETRLIQA